MLFTLFASWGVNWGKGTAFLKRQGMELDTSCPIKDTLAMGRGDSLQKGSESADILCLSVVKQLPARRTPTHTSTTLSSPKLSDLLNLGKGGGRMQSYPFKKKLPEVHVNYKTVSYGWSYNWWEIKKNKAVKMIITKDKKKPVWEKVGKSVSRMTTVLENYWALFIKAIRQEC